MTREGAKNTAWNMEGRVRRFLNKPWFWFGVAYFGLVIAFVLYGAARRDIVKEQTIRISTQKAANIDKVNKCFADRAQLPTTIRFLDFFETIASNQKHGYQLNLQTLPNDPRAVGKNGWIASLYRTTNALGDIQAIEQQIKDKTPTYSKCAAKAERLGVPIPPQYLPKKDRGKDNS